MRWYVVSIALLLTVLTVMAQKITVNKIQYNELIFTYDSTMADSDEISRVKGDDPTEIFPGGPNPPYTYFQLHADWTISTAWSTRPAIEVKLIPMDELEKYEGSWMEATQLQSMLSNRENLDRYESGSATTVETRFPYLPAQSTQIIRTQAEYVDTSVFEGIRYVAIYDFEPDKIVSGDIMYTFQGISRDRQYYLSVTAYLRTQLFEEDINIDDYPAFLENYAAYIKDSFNALNNAQENAFVPNLSTLDNMIQSMQLDESFLANNS